jgi:hypothetical protein
LHQVDPRMVDRAHFALRGSNIEAIQETKGQPKDDAYLSDTSNSSHGCRVPLTTLATDEDFKYNESTSEDTFQDVRPKPRQLLHSLKKPRVSFKIATGHTSESSPSIKVSSSNKDPLSKTVTNAGIFNPTIDKKPFSLALPTELKSPEATSTTFYTYRDQLTFNLSSSTEGVNVAKYFRQWVFSASKSIDNFSLVPYDDEKGIQISHLDQVPEENREFCSAYYHNHRVLNH